MAEQSRSVPRVSCPFGERDKIGNFSRTTLQERKCCAVRARHHPYHNWRRRKKVTFEVVHTHLLRHRDQARHRCGFAFQTRLSFPAWYRHPALGEPSRLCPGHHFRQRRPVEHILRRPQWAEMANINIAVRASRLPLRKGSTQPRGRTARNGASSAAARPQISVCSFFTRTNGAQQSVPMALIEVCERITVCPVVSILVLLGRDHPAHGHPLAHWDDRHGRCAACAPRVKKQRSASLETKAAADSTLQRACGSSTPAWRGVECRPSAWGVLRRRWTMSSTDAVTYTPQVCGVESYGPAACGRQLRSPSVGCRRLAGKADLKCEAASVSGLILVMEKPGGLSTNNPRSNMGHDPMRRRSFCFFSLL